MDDGVRIAIFVLKGVTAVISIFGAFWMVTAFSYIIRPAQSRLSKASKSISHGNLETFMKKVKEEVDFLARISKWGLN